MQSTKVCADNPDKEFASCDVAEEEWDEEELAEDDWVEEAEGQPMEVEGVLV